MKQKQTILILIILSGIITAGCVERLITVKTEPAGAVVYLNDEEVGTSPVTVPFTWYGTYEVVVRRDGYETIRTARTADAPFYEWPGIDLISECLLPFDIVDHHEWSFDLTAQTPVDPNALIERAQVLREQTLKDD